MDIGQRSSRKTGGSRDNTKPAKVVVETEESKQRVFSGTHKNIDYTLANSEIMEIHPNNDITNLDNEETSTALANANEKEAESEGNESYNSVEKVYFCTMCDEKFSKEKYLEAHVYMRHVVDKIFNCPYCDRTFDDKGNLKLHEKTHKDIRAFSCSAFNKQFKSKIYLKSHEKLHNGEKPFSAQTVTRGFHKVIN